RITCKLRFAPHGRSSSAWAGAARAPAAGGVGARLVARVDTVAAVPLYSLRAFIAILAGLGGVRGIDRIGIDGLDGRIVAHRLTHIRVFIADMAVRRVAGRQCNAAAGEEQKL